MPTKKQYPDKVSEAHPLMDEEKSVVELMEESRQTRFAETMRALHGKLHLDLDIDELRGRSR